MGLYNNIVHWDFNMDQGEYVSWVRYTFAEINLDPVFRVLAIHSDYTIDVEVVQSSVLDIGTTYLRQPVHGFRRVKLTNLKPFTDKAYSPSTALPQPKEKEEIIYERNK